MIIKPEDVNDKREIFDLTRLAFTGHPHSNGSEPYIIDALRRDGDLTLSLVGRDKAGIIQAHIAFSPVKIGEHDNWLGLGPVSVHPSVQGKGLGASIIKEGLSRIQALGVVGCALIGNPNYYFRFGFHGKSGVTYGDLPVEYVQQLPFKGATIIGEVVYAPGFSAQPIEDEGVAEL